MGNHLLLQHVGRLIIFLFLRLSGVPLPLFGMLAYGLVASLGLQLGTEKKTFDTAKSDSEIILVGITTSMAVASSYFLYILSTQFAGESCLYCLTSATLSFSLFFITLKVCPWQDSYSFNCLILYNYRKVWVHVAEVWPTRASKDIGLTAICSGPGGYCVDSIL